LASAITPTKFSLIYLKYFGFSEELIQSLIRGTQMGGAIKE